MDSCFILSNTKISHINGCLNIKYAKCVKLNTITFEKIIGDVPLYIENSNLGQINYLCFSNCESNFRKSYWGTAFFIKSTNLSLNSTSVFGCIASYDLNYERYISCVESQSLIVNICNSSFCRSIRGTGLLVTKSTIIQYSNCIYANDFCGSITTYVQELKTPGLTTGLVFINNIHDSSDEMNGILFCYALSSVSMTIENSFFINNQVQAYFQANAPLNIKGCTFSVKSDYIQSSNINLYDNNDFSILNNRILPDYLDKDLICFNEKQITMNVTYHSYLIYIFLFCLYQNLCSTQCII